MVIAPKKKKKEEEKKIVATDTGQMYDNPVQQKPKENKVTNNIDNSKSNSNIPTATFTDVKTGEPTGFDFKGNTYLGSPELVSEAVNRGQEKLQEQANARNQIIPNLNSFQEQTGSASKIEELQSKILTPQELTPDSLLDVGIKKMAGTEGKEPEPFPDFVQRLLNGGGSKEDIKSASRAIKGGALTGAAIAALGSIPFVANAIAGSSLATSIIGTGGSATSLKLLGEAFALYTVGGKVLDYEGKEMQSYRAAIQKTTEDGERIEASVKNGYSPSEAVSLLIQMSDEVDTAERKLKELGNYNIQYRTSKEYIEDQKNIRSARIALQRRLLAVENIATTGQGVLNQQALLFEATQK